MNKSEGIIIVGAGLVGSLLATMLVKKGFEVVVYERRSDPRIQSNLAGRSINLALSHRGIRALNAAGVFDKIESQLIPMKGRKMHDINGDLTFQPYGREGQHINSVSRNELNKCLINEAQEFGVNFYFEHSCDQVDFEKSEVLLTSPNGESRVSGSVIFGTDGAFSNVRSAFQKSDRFNYSQHYIEHGYKELSMLPKDGDFAMEPNFLHIWPRGSFMLIALPNPDKTFTCTLFFPFEGEVSFKSLLTDSDILSFFQKEFADITTFIPDLVKQFKENPSSSLVTIKCFPWLSNRTMILGDASHAIVPFYGQGMNAGFEDCRLLMEMAETNKFDWDFVLPLFQKTRKKDTDAIADLALKNFVEMRDWVGDDKFLLRKKIEARLNDEYPKQWTPQYSMVTFSDIPYSEAQELGKRQDKIMIELLDTKFITDIDNIDLMSLVNQL